MFDNYYIKLLTWLLYYFLSKSNSATDVATLLTLCGVHTARFLKYVWPFYNIMHERANWDEILI